MISSRRRDQTPDPDTDAAAAAGITVVGGDSVQFAELCQAEFR